MQARLHADWERRRRSLVQYQLHSPQAVGPRSRACFFFIPVSHPCAPEGFKIVNISGTQVTVHVCGNCLTSSSRMPYKATRYSAPCVPLQDPSECE